MLGRLIEGWDYGAVVSDPVFQTDLNNPQIWYKGCHEQRTRLKMGKIVNQEFNDKVENDI